MALSPLQLRNKRTRKEARRKAVRFDHMVETEVLRVYGGTKLGDRVAVRIAKREYKNHQKHHRKMNGEHTRKYKFEHGEN